MTTLSELWNSKNQASIKTNQDETSAARDAAEHIANERTKSDTVNATEPTVRAPSENDIAMTSNVSRSNTVHTTHENDSNIDTKLFTQVYKRKSMSKKQHQRTPFKTLGRTTIRNRFTTPFNNSHCSSSTLNSKPAAKKAKRISSKDGRQLYLDFGQQSFGERTCNKCGMAIQSGLEVDEKAHDLYCKAKDSSKLLKINTISRSAALSNWNRGGTEFQIFKLESKHVQQSIAAIINPLLGFAEIEEKKALNWFVCVKDGNALVAAIVSEPITTSFRVIVNRAKSDVHNTAPIEHSKETVEASVGVQRLWVHNSYRRQGVATKLLDAVRVGSVYGCQVPINHMAFSQPTQLGAAVAAKYFGRQDFLVYMM